MATSHEGVSGLVSKSEEKTGLWYLNMKPAMLFIGLLLFIFVGSRFYQGWAGWAYGLDSTAPEFDTYWMSYLYMEMAIEAITFFIVVPYIWMTRDRNLDKLAPQIELKRMFFFLSMLLVYAFSFYFAGSFFAEQDASWHQTVVRDTSFTPSHIIVFYLCMPVFIIIGLSLLTWAITRLPFYSKQISIPFVMVVVGPFMLFPNVGFNEWGHAFWIMEEYFTVPLHWGVVLFGWAILALGGVLYQVVQHLIVLLPRVYDDKGEMIATN